MICSIFDINIYVTISIVAIFSLITGGSIVAHYLKNFEKLEKLIALISKFLRFICKTTEYTYVKYDIQSRVNGFVADLSKKVPHIIPTRVKLEWIDENVKPEQFINSGHLVMRMHKSTNHNKNVVNATFTFVSYSLLRKAKNYIAKYQKNAIDLFVSFKILEHSKYELIDEFVQEYLNAGLDNEKIADFYDRFFDIDKAGLYFPVFITEMTFLGEKVFGKKRENERVFEEVKKMVNFLYYYANRRLNQDTISEYNGEYCKFAIRIIGKRMKIDTEGKKVYINNIKKIPKSIETIYLIGDEQNTDFIDSVVKSCNGELGFDIFTKHLYKAIGKDRDGNEIEFKSCLVVLRNKEISVYHKN
jgi:hypothetical protein